MRSRLIRGVNSPSLCPYSPGLRSAPLCARLLCRRTRTAKRSAWEAARPPRASRPEDGGVADANDGDCHCRLAVANNSVWDTTVSGTRQRHATIALSQRRDSDTTVVCSLSRRRATDGFSASAMPAPPCLPRRGSGSRRQRDWCPPDWCHHVHSVTGLQRDWCPPIRACPAMPAPPLHLSVSSCGSRCGPPPGDNSRAGRV